MPVVSSDPWSSTPADRFEMLAHEYGTPLYLYDAEDVMSRVQQVRDAFEGQAQVYFAVKANPNLGLLRSLLGKVDGLDISSGGELDQAQLAGYDPASLSFAGPAKNRAELTAAILSGAGCISIESVRELDDCVQIAREQGRRANVAVRVNPKLLNRAFGMKMGGRAIQFGVDEEELHSVLPRIAACADALDFRGIHVYAGSQCFDASGVVEGVTHTLEIVREIESSTALRCSTINLGGGFGLSHTDADKEIDIAALGSALTPVLRSFVASSRVPRRIVFELGRYLAANAGIYVARVISSKISRGKCFFMVDGGLHHQLAAAGTFGAALRSNFVLRNLSRPEAPPVRCNIAGPSCNPTDLLGIDAELPRPEIGDLIGVLKSGAYGLTASPLLFLGRHTPAEVVAVDGKFVLGRRSRPMTDFN